MKRFRFDSRGTALTEFVIFLPIWITCLIGVINLGLAGVDSTAVQLTANQTLWSQAIPLTKKEEAQLLGREHATPIGAGQHKASSLLEIAEKEGNDHRVVDTAEAVAHGGALALGHWGEGAVTTSGLPPRFAPVSLYVSTRANVQTHSDPNAVLKGRKYANLLLNDQLGEQSFNGAAPDILANLITGSGITSAFAAGIRFGDVFASEEREISLLKGTPTITAGAHYDMLVAPRATSKEDVMARTYAPAWLMAQNVDYYRKMLRFGKSEFHKTND